jgi:hypothetical protein
MFGNSKNLPRGGKRNGGTFRYRPKGLQASDPPISERELNSYGLYVQKPHQIIADQMNGGLDYLDWEDLRAIDLARESRQHFEMSLKLEKENEDLKAENQRLRDELELLKHQQSNPPSSGRKSAFIDVDVITQIPATKRLRMMHDFFRKTRLFFILLDTFNQILKHRCNIDDSEVEGGGSVLRKIFELVTSTGADIHENSLTIPDLDFKVHCSKEQFDEFANKVGEWAFENKLNFPNTHFIIGEMRKFTSKKPMPNGQMVEYDKFTIQIIDLSIKEKFMVDIMNLDGSIVLPCDWTPNSIVFSPTHGIYTKDPLKPHATSDFLGVIRDIMNRSARCMTTVEKGIWKFDSYNSVLFLFRGIKMKNAGYTMYGGPIIEYDTCPIILEDDAACVRLTGCNCKSRDGKSIPYTISISACVDLYDSKRCPNCRGIFKNFQCSDPFPKEKSRDPFSLAIQTKEKPSESEVLALRESVSKMSENYSFSFKFSDSLTNALQKLSLFSRRIYGDEVDQGFDHAIMQENAIVSPAPVSRSVSQMRSGGGAASPVPESQIRSGSGAASSVPARIHRYYDSSSDDDFGIIDLHYILRGS